MKSILAFSILIGSLWLFSSVAVYELSYESFNPVADEVFRLNEVQYFNKPDSQKVALTMYPMGPALFNRFEEIENFTRMQHLGDVFLSNETGGQYAYGIFADTAFFNIFGMPLVSTGNSERPLANKNEVVITKTLANKLFKSENVIGRKCSFLGVDFDIVGVMNDPPVNSHLQFEFLVSLKTIEKNLDLIDWTKNSYLTYLLLDDKRNYEVVQSKLEEFEKANLEDPSLYTLYLQPLKDVHLVSEDLVHDPVNFNKSSNTVVTGSLIVIILLYILIVSFLLANVKQGMSFGRYALSFIIGICLAVAILWFVHPLVIQLLFNLGYIQSGLIVLGITLTPLLIFLIIDKITGVVSLTGTNYSSALARYAYVPLLTVSVALLGISVLTLYFNLSRQILAKSLMPGYEQDNIVEIPLTSTAGEALKPVIYNLRNDSSITDMTAAVEIPLGSIHQRGIDHEGKNPGKRIVASVMSVDANFLNFFDIPVKEGRNFSSTSFLDKENVYIINESLARLIGWQEGDRIGRSIGFQSATQGVLIGVIDDFNFLPGYCHSGPLLLQFSDEPNVLLLKYDSRNRKALLSNLSAEWGKWNKDPLRYTDYSDRFNQKHSANILLIDLMVSLLLLSACFVLLLRLSGPSGIPGNKVWLIVFAAAVCFGLTYILLKDDSLTNAVDGVSNLADILVVFGVLVIIALLLMWIYTGRIRAGSTINANISLLLLLWMLNSCSTPAVLEEQPKTFAIADLGERLFFDPMLSKNRKVSCATCHIPDLAFSDTLRFSPGDDGTPTKRNTPTVGYLTSIRGFFWDGRATTLEQQATIPITDPHEMGLSLDILIERLESDSTYRADFEELFSGKPDSANISFAIAEYQRTLVFRSSAYDLYVREQDSSLMSAEALHGARLFFGKARCSQCHGGNDFTDGDFRNIGINTGDQGRYDHTANEEDIRKFKTPTLRNIGITPPYMHDGSMPTLREVLEFYNEPPEEILLEANLDTLMKTPLGLSENELKALEAFLHTLTDEQFKSN